EQVLSFLKKQSYAKKANLTNVLSVLGQVIKNSKLITVILISSGESPIQGTPFDETINENYRFWQQPQQKSRMPLVTVLRAKDGKIIKSSVNPAPWKAEFPPWPVEAPPPQVAETKPPPQVKPPPIGAPLIISGKKRVVDANATNADAGK